MIMSHDKWQILKCIVYSTIRSKQKKKKRMVVLCIYNTREFNRDFNINSQRYRICCQMKLFIYKIRKLIALISIVFVNKSILHFISCKKFFSSIYSMLCSNIFHNQKNEKLERSRNFNFSRINLYRTRKKKELY